MDDGGWGSIRVLEFSAWVLTATAKLQIKIKLIHLKKIRKKFRLRRAYPHQLQKQSTVLLVWLAAG